jgi:DNA-directed RNA polymerase subunit RPC12/RpoP
MNWIAGLQRGWHSQEYQCSECKHWIRHEVKDELPLSCEKCGSKKEIMNSSTCPLCGVDTPHNHSPAEQVIYKNGVKAGSIAAPQQAIPAIDVNKMVDRFLGWKLPSDFSPDAGINFNKLPHLHDSHEWPIGTNLLTAPQAKAMFEYCIHYQSDFDLEYTAKRIRRLLNSLNIPDPSDGNDNTLMGCLFSLLGQACGKLESAAPTAPIERDK